MIEIQKTSSHGFTLPDYDIGLDVAGKKTPYTFISHAHADHMPRSSQATVIATPATAKLMKARGFKGSLTELEFQKPLSLPDATVTLYPAGHILGSAMIFVETQEGNLLYTGDFRYPPSPASEGFILPEKVDYLITEATFGLPIYRWPKYEFLYKDMRLFTIESIKNGFTPVFLAYSLGKTQEIMHALKSLGYPFMIHKNAYSLCEIYNEMGFDLGSYSSINYNSLVNHIIITPQSGLRDENIVSIKKKKIAYASGWAALESRSKTMNFDKSIVLSDHSDFFELINICEQLKPQKVFITHTPDPSVICHYLNERNIQASPI